MKILSIIISVLLIEVRSEVYPCTIAKCSVGLTCHAVEASCFRRPCPLVARCINETKTFDPCSFGRQVLQRTGQPFYCGGGINSRMCPRFTKCIADPMGQFAACCWSNFGDYVDKPSMDTLAYDGICPFIPPPYAVGVCVEQCKSDGDCMDNTKCCNTGCGHMCLNAVTRKPKFTCPVPSENPFGSCVEVCNFESDCKLNEQCCSNGCGRVCMTAKEASVAMHSTKLRNVVRPGFCPAEQTVRYMECNDKEQCTTDADCFGIRKCCFNDQCGHICLNPKKKQLYVNKRLYEWKIKAFQ